MPMLKARLLAALPLLVGLASGTLAGAPDNVAAEIIDLLARVGI